MTLVLPRAYLENPADFGGTRLDGHDPAYLREYLPLLEIMYRYYFRVRAKGFANLPNGEPFLIVGNHNGGINAPDTAMTLHAWYTTRGADSPVHALIHPSIFTMPYLNVHVTKLGGVSASARMARKVLESGTPLLVYPGAGDDAYKPYKDRHKIKLFGRDAFIRLALRMNIPVVPVVSVGAHETLIVLDDGRERARAMGLDKQGVERVPLTFSFPYGFALGAPLNIPFPVRMQLEMGSPIRFATSHPRPDRDPATVKRCYDAVVQVMQSMLDRMLLERNAATSAST